MSEAPNKCSKCGAVIPHKRRVCLKCQKEARQELKKNLKTPHKYYVSEKEKLINWFLI